MNDSRPVPRMAAAAAWAAALLFGVVAAFHAAIVFGAPWGEHTQGGGTSGAVDTSGRAVAAVSCVISAVMAAAILGWAPVSMVLLGLVTFVMVTTNRRLVPQSGEVTSAHSRSADR